MARFHFNSCTGGVILPDAEGEELPGLEARQVAMESAREALLEAIKSRDTPPDLIQVTDDEGRDLLTVHLVDVFRQPK